MNDRTGLSKGDRNRNARLARLRELLPLDNAIVGIDLAPAAPAIVRGVGMLRTAEHRAAELHRPREFKTRHILS